MGAEGMDWEEPDERECPKTGCSKRVDVRVSSDSEPAIRYALDDDPEAVHEVSGVHYIHF